MRRYVSKLTFERITLGRHRGERSKLCVSGNAHTSLGLDYIDCPIGNIFIVFRRAVYIILVYVKNILCCNTQL